MNDQSKNYFKESLRYHLALKKNRTQAWLSERTGISQQTISKILRGQSRGTHESQLKIVAVFELDYLSFLKKGEHLSGNTFEKKTPNYSANVLTAFHDKKTIKNFVTLLHELETIDPPTYYRLYNQTKFELSNFQKDDNRQLLGEA
ncbi:MAG: helix-turn-helix transcriptional regulator [Candidatus Marinimicrobia bacterium]|jgi:transcriptional regulator with XRE-family HTH domain|nr:helix-turn-helix transcriptional regulator [Candidatus Neomarinimicrobiota bacterium]